MTIVNSTRLLCATLVGLLGAASAGCSSHGSVVVDGGVRVGAPGDDQDDHATGPGKGRAKGNKHKNSATAHNIPPGHMPAPGMARIWYPDLPPGQQPPPFECADYEHPHVPAGAWLIRG